MISTVLMAMAKMKDRTVEPAAYPVSECVSPSWIGHAIDDTGGHVAIVIVVDGL